ncbi:MAG: class I SAM-dependent methyltransferase [Actinomycetota bacterium]
MNRDYRAHYEEAYATGASEWRRIGALDKAANLQQMWAGTEQVGPPASILDIGCGDGSLAAELSRTGFLREYTGVDLSEHAIEAARERATPDTKWTAFDGRTVPVADRSFELAVLSHVLEHVEHPRYLLYEAARTSRWVFVEVPLELHSRTPEDFAWTATGHINLFNSTVLRHLVQSAGLQVVKQSSYPVRREAIEFQRGRVKGAAIWALREGAHRLSASFAERLVTYHGCLIARPADPSP